MVAVPDLKAAIGILADLDPLSGERTADLVRLFATGVIALWNITIFKEAHSGILVNPSSGLWRW
ncbi:hypothetical protein IP81_15205 [Novosphingobium sp. AAP83]|nr:hypothetical protein IP81_15205 [Novosphingobium sp. AAP83]